MRNRAAVVIIAAFAASACAQTYQPVVDRGQPGFSTAKYQSDLGECRAYAEQVDPASEAAGGAVIGAVLGAMLGAATGAAYGNAGQGAAVGTAMGGTSGLAAGGAGGVKGQIQIIRRCLAGRGYIVLR